VEGCHFKQRYHELVREELELKGRKLVDATFWHVVRLLASGVCSGARGPMGTNLVFYLCITSRQGKNGRRVRLYVQVEVEVAGWLVVAVEVSE
jgi:hypothetical protein